MTASWSLGDFGISSSPRGRNGIAKPAASSSLRSRRSLRSLVMPIHTTVPTMPTTIAAAMAVANATRVRSEGVLVKNRDSGAIGLLLSQDEPHAANRMQQPRSTASLQFAAEVADEHVDDVGVGGEVVTPDQLQQLSPGQHGRLVFGQHGEQVELALGQVDIDAVDAGTAAGNVDLEWTDRDGLRRER